MCNADADTKSVEQRSGDVVTRVRKHGPRQVITRGAVTNGTHIKIEGVGGDSADAYLETQGRVNRGGIRGAFQSPLDLVHETPEFLRMRELDDVVHDALPTTRRVAGVPIPEHRGETPSLGAVRLVDEELAPPLVRRYHRAVRKGATVGGPLPQRRVGVLVRVVVDVAAPAATSESPRRREENAAIEVHQPVAEIDTVSRG